jgi:hypothetical protein
MIHVVQCSCGLTSGVTLDCEPGQEQLCRKCGAVLDISKAEPLKLPQDAPKELDLLEVG